MEVWKIIKCCPKYEISNYGRIKRILPGKGAKVGNIVSGSKDDKGYLVFKFTENGKQKGRKIHKMVLEAFVGPRPEGMECRHLDGDRSNNKLDNLCWSTHKENCNDKIIHGTINRGIRNGRCKLSKKEIENIRNDDRSCAKVALDYSIAPSYVWGVRNNLYRNDEKYEE